MTIPAQYSSPSPGGSPWHLPQLRHRVAVPLVVMLLTATVGRLLVLSPQITDGETALLEGLSQHRNVLLDTIATVAALALSNGGVVLIIAAVIGWLAVLRRSPLDATGFGITALSGWAAIGVVKLVVERPRPVLSGDPLGAVTGSMSFPSSHTGAAVAIVLGLALVSRRARSRRALLFWGTVTVTVVAAARVYSGAHYPLDVLAALPVAFVGTMAGASMANTVVPALAWGFSWHQAGTTVAAPATRRSTAVPERERTATGTTAAPTTAATTTASEAGRRVVRPASARHDERADRAA